MRLKISLAIFFFLGITSLVIAQRNVNIKNVSLPNAQNNQNVSLAEFSTGKGLILIFTSNYCPYSKLYENRIDKLAATYADRGIKVVLVNSNNPNASKDDSLDEMAKKASGKGYNYPYLADKEQKLQTILGATKTPEVYLLRPQGDQFTIVYSGGFDDNPQVEEDVSKYFLKDAVDAMLANKDPQVKSTRATGCMIKKN